MKTENILSIYDNNTSSHRFIKIREIKTMSHPPFEPGRMTPPYEIVKFGYEELHDNVWLNNQQKFDTIEQLLNSFNEGA